MGRDASTRHNQDGTVPPWRWWRFCCCRYGWYPLLLAPFVTAACLLDLYSSLDCNFLTVNVGFIPSNTAWNETSVDLGFFFYQSWLEDESRYRRVFAPGCREFTDDFDSYFIDGDRTWEVARIMAAVSGISGIVAVATIWVIVLTPIPACFIWPGVLLPALLITFLSGGSKFLFFDTAICHSPLWSPGGPDSLLQVAKSCVLGKSAYFAIAAGSAFFIILLIVCLKAPKKRPLEQAMDEGALNHHQRGMELETREHVMDSDMDPNLDKMSESIAEDSSSYVGQSRRGSMTSVDQNDSFTASTDGKSHNLCSHDYPSRDLDSVSDGNVSKENRHDVEDVFEIELAQPREETIKPLAEKRDDSFEPISKPNSHDSENSDRLSFDETRQSPVKVSPTNMRVSQARLSKAEMLKHSHKRKASDELIEKCVLDLTKSFQSFDIGVVEEAKTEELSV